MSNSKDLELLSSVARCDRWRWLTTASAVLGRGVSYLLAGQVISGGAEEGVPRDGQSVGHVRGGDGDSDGHPDVVSAPAQLGRGLRRSDRRIGRTGQGALEVRADRSPGTPAASAR